VNDETAPEPTVEDLPPLATELAAAHTLDALAEVLLRVLEGESESTLFPHRYIIETYKGLSRALRDDVDMSVLRLLEALAAREEWNTDASVELLLLTRTLFASREVAPAALVCIARILANPDDYAAETAVAAGQAAIALGYYGAPDLWYRLYQMAGNYAVPTVVGGLARTDWKSLLDWLDQRRHDAWIERTVINLLPAFLVTQGAERVRGLANSIWASTSESGREEIHSFMKRMGLEFEPADSAVEPARSDWALILRALLRGELTTHVGEAGGVEPYLRKLFVGRGEDAATEFRDVLNTELIDWRDGLLRSDHFIDTMLDLICAFRPDRGAAKTIECLEENGATLSGQAILKAFNTLAIFYEKSPARGARALLYARYLRLLRQFTCHAEVGSYALNALLRLNAIDFKDRQFASMVVSDESRQQQVVDFAVAAPWNEKLLSWLLDASVRGSWPDRPAVFKTFVKSLRQHAGVLLNLWWQSIGIGSNVTIPVSRDLNTRYVRLRQAVAVPEGYETYKLITGD
jgi:hypothetical protein